MNSHFASSRSFVLTAALAAFALLGLIALSGSSASAAAAKPKSYECQHPLVTGEEAVNPKGISPKEACKVVRSLGKYLSKQENVEALYECKGATAKKPGKPVLLQTEFEGWHLKLVNGYNFVMYKKGASFRVTGQDFPVNCS